MEIFFYILLAFLTFIIFGGVLNFIKKSISESVYEITKPKKDIYNYCEINLVDFIQTNRIHFINISCRYDNSLRYLKLKHLETDCTSYKSTYFVISKNIDSLMKNEIPKDYIEDYINNDKLEKVLMFLIKKCNVFSYTDYPKDKFVHYQFNLKNISNKHENNIESAEKTHSKILSTVKLFSTIYWDGRYINYSYKDSYVKLIKENNWVPQTLLIEKSWFYEKYSKEWKSIRLEQIKEN